MLKSKSLFLGLTAVLVAGFALGSQAIPNWSAPATWTPPRAAGAHALDITNPLPFVGITPCRVADTRGNGFVGAYGPPSLAANANRTFVIAGQCGIPFSARAVSFNLGVLNVGGAGDLRVFPDGAALPTVSTLNYNANTPNIANAAVVPLGGTAGITVRADAVSVDLIIDVNGYYYDGTSLALPPGSQFQIIGTCNSCSTVYGENQSTSSGSRAIRGVASATTGSSYGVLGQVSSTTTDSSGLRGEANGTTGIINGAEGRTFSLADGSTGVAGFDSRSSVSLTPGFGFSTGVRGNAGNGVAGVTSTGGGYGVTGVLTNSAGTITGQGILGIGTHGVYALVGDVACAGCVKSFVDPHPTDPTKEIHYVSLEGNEAGTYFRGTAQTVDGNYVINVPEDFKMVTDAEGLTVQLTPVGSPATMYVVSEDLDQIVVNSSRDVKFHYLVQGIRPAFKNFKPIQDNMTAFLPQTPSGRMPAGWTEWMKARLIANGTYNPDGTINMTTAERVGWAQKWREQEEQDRAVAAARAAERAAELFEPPSK